MTADGVRPAGFNLKPIEALFLQLIWGMGEMRWLSSYSTVLKITISTVPTKKTLSVDIEMEEGNRGTEECGQPIPDSFSPKTAEENSRTMSMFMFICSCQRRIVYAVYF